MLGKSADLGTCHLAKDTEAACVPLRWQPKLGSAPSSRNGIQSLERGFTPAILLGVRLAGCSHSAAA